MHDGRRSIFQYLRQRRLLMYFLMQRSRLFIGSLLLASLALSTAAITILPAGIFRAQTGGGTICPSDSFASVRAYGMQRATALAAGPDGNLWFTDEYTDEIYRIGGAITNFSLLPPKQGRSLLSITAGPDGNLWFTEAAANKIGKITPTGEITEFALPTANSSPLIITAGPDGNVWFTEHSGNKIGRITPTGTITEFPIPTPSSFPQGIVTGPDGNLWFTERNSSKIGKITPTGTITEFPITGGNFPLRIATGPDGNLWFTEGAANKIGRITPTGTITEFPVPTGNSHPMGITAGPDGNLWFTEYLGGKIGKITPTGTITEFPIPAANSYPIEITTGSDGNLWFTTGDFIVRFTDCTSARSTSGTDSSLDALSALTSPEAGSFLSPETSSNTPQCPSSYNCSVTYDPSGQRYELAVECGNSPQGIAAGTYTEYANETCGRADDPNPGKCYRCVTPNDGEGSDGKKSDPGVYNPDSCMPICGDGIRIGNEECDDRNMQNGDGCSATCKKETARNSRKTSFSSIFSSQNFSNFIGSSSSKIFSESSTQNSIGLEGTSSAGNVSISFQGSHLSSSKVSPSQSSSTSISSLRQSVGFSSPHISKSSSSSSRPNILVLHESASSKTLPISSASTIPIVSSSSRSSYRSASSTSMDGSRTSSSVSSFSCKHTSQCPLRHVCVHGACVTADQTTSHLAPPLCGNRTTDVGEECDDGNSRDGDGCNRSCKKDNHAAASMSGGSSSGELTNHPPVGNTGPEVLVFMAAGAASGIAWMRRRKRS